MLIQITSRDTLMILRLFTDDSFQYGNRFTVVNARRNRAHQGSVKTGTTVDKEALRIMESMILAQQRAYCKRRKLLHQDIAEDFARRARSTCR